MARVRNESATSGRWTSTPTASPGISSPARIAAIPRSHTFTERPGTVSGIPDRSTVTSSGACTRNRGTRLRDGPSHPRICALAAIEPFICLSFICLSFRRKFCLSEAVLPFQKSLVIPSEARNLLSHPSPRFPPCNSAASLFRLGGAALASAAISLQQHPRPLAPEAISSTPQSHSLSQTTLHSPSR